MNNLPPTDDQIRVIQKLCKIDKMAFTMPQNRQEADEVIEKLAGEDHE